MSEKGMENNQVTVCGVIASGFAYSHAIYGEGFYRTKLLVPRLSDSFDLVPVTISERLLDVSMNHVGSDIRIFGQFRSYNQHDGNKNRLLLSVFAREVEFLREEIEGEKANEILLNGYLCKKPIYRKTPLGREIADLLIAVNRPYGKSDYIPCICWGRNALFAAGFEVGAPIRVRGRIQSREYTKVLSETEFEQRIAYEVSVSKLGYGEEKEEVPGQEL